MTEHAVSFICQGEQLLGILHCPEQPASDLGVVIVVGGPQYRAGSHRQFVHLARALADGGFPALRFDCRGMGDSSGSPRSFEQLDDDIRAAVAELQARVPTVQRVVLWGLCDGASAALLYMNARRDPAVHGLALANPWVRTEATLARTQLRHYYWRRLLQGEFWRQRLTGKGWGPAWRGFIETVRSRRELAPAARAHFSIRMAHGWMSFGGDILLVLSGDDMTASEFVEATRASTEWRGALTRTNVKRFDLRGADHTFSRADWRDAVGAATVAWLRQIAAPSARRLLAGG
ncbi:MAG: hypothetical protein LKCHEGNO_00084 [Burkholderiaceae bacterium]|nr:hypothetical protein [Burkholderiaceae bacterium]